MSLKRTLGLLIAGLLVGVSWPALVLAQAPATSQGVVTGLQGSATLARPTAQPVAVKFKDDLFLRDRVDTRADSIVRVLLGGKALVTVRELSSFTVSEEPGRAVVELHSGKVALHAVRSLLKPGESVQIRTPNAVAAVRGSLLIAEVKEVGGVPQSSFTAVSASVPITVAPLSDPADLTSLSGGTFFSLSGFGTGTTKSPVLNITPAQAAAAASLASGPRGSGHEDKAPAELTSRVVAAKMTEAGDLATVIAPASPIGAAAAGATTPQPPPVSTNAIGVNAPAAEQEERNETLAGIALGQQESGHEVIPTPIPETIPEPIPETIPEPIPELIPDGRSGPRPGPPVVLSGTTKTLAAGESLMLFVGQSNTASTAPQIQITNTTVTGASNDLVHVATGSNGTLAGQLMRVTGTSAFTSNSVLDVRGVLSSTTSSAFLDIDPTTVTAVDMFRIGAGGNLSLGGPLLSDTNGTYNVSGNFLAVTDGGQLRSTGPGPLLRFTNTRLNVGHLLFMNGAGSRVTLAGPLLSSASAPVTVNGSSLVEVTGGGAFSSTTVSPLVSIGSANLILGGGAAGFVFAGGGTASLAGPLLSVSSGALNVADRSLFIASGGGQVTTSSALPLVSLTAGIHSIAPSGAAMFSLTGSATALDTESGLTVGTDQPLRYAGSLIETTGATVGAQTVVFMDTALVAASAPLLSLNGGSVFTTSGNGADLSLRAKVTSLGAVVRLDASTLTVNGAALVNLAGGSFLRVTGDLIDLRNGSTLTLTNGTLLNVSGGSVVNISGSLVAFNGTLATNAVNVTNNVCPPPACGLVSGIPVFLTGGATVANVSIGSTPIKNPNLGAVNFSSPTAAAIVVNGATSRVTIVTSPTQ